MSTSRPEPLDEAGHRDDGDPDRRPSRPDGEERKPRTWTPWLVVRYTLSDDGRQRPVPDKTVFWTSPDISVESSDVLGNPVAGEANFVHAHVFNLGKAQARPTRVDFYWGDPALALGPGHMNYIGSEWVVVPYHKSRDVRCPSPWVPTTAGHHCLMVNASADIDDPIQLPLQPRLDRHVGQRNVSVVQAAGGHQLHYALAVNNLAPMAANIAVAARVEHVRIERSIARTMADRDVVDHVATYRRHAGGFANSRPGLVRDVAGESRFGRSAPHIESALSERSSIVPSREGAAHFAHLLMAGDRDAPSGELAEGRRDIVLHELTMNAFEERRLELALGVPPNAEPGEFVVVHLMQTIGGLSAGGYTIVVRIGAAGREG